ncbi:MAG: 16S rRNA (uracil(1498)-N(3))-methyltransferase [Candidatus Omnitrophica bacterium]|nr:16S rRNA (uracil(1498)-N(3))-methyltransferase [Candidatus Omnitrophota bacterium]
MHRVLVPPQCLQGRAIAIRDPNTLHHLLHVLRVQVGDPLECFDGQGQGYRGSVIRRSKRALVVAIDAKICEPAPRLRVTLALSLIRPERFEWALQKATELNVERVIPMIAVRTTARVSGDRASRKLERWRRIVREAAQQCGRLRVPELQAPQPLAALLPELDQYDTVLMPTLAGQTIPLERGVEPVSGPSRVAMLIGPEGDFTEEEAKVATQHGATLLSLGRLTLRSETAAIALLAILQYAARAL